MAFQRRSWNRKYCFTRTLLRFFTKRVNKTTRRFIRRVHKWRDFSFWKKTANNNLKCLKKTSVHLIAPNLCLTSNHIKKIRFVKWTPLIRPWNFKMWYNPTFKIPWNRIKNHWKGVVTWSIRTIQLHSYSKHFNCIFLWIYSTSLRKKCTNSYRYCSFVLNPLFSLP